MAREPKEQTFEKGSYVRIKGYFGIAVVLEIAKGKRYVTVERVPGNPGSAKAMQERWPEVEWKSQISEDWVPMRHEVVATGKLRSVVTW